MADIVGEDNEVVPPCVTVDSLPSSSPLSSPFVARDEVFVAVVVVDPVDVVVFVFVSSSVSSEAGGPLTMLWTVRRWVSRFHVRANDFGQGEIGQGKSGGKTMGFSVTETDCIEAEFANV